MRPRVRRNHPQPPRRRPPPGRIFGLKIFGGKEGQGGSAGGFSGTKWFLWENFRPCHISTGGRSPGSPGFPFWAVRLGKGGAGRGRRPRLGTWARGAGGGGPVVPHIWTAVAPEGGGLSQEGRRVRLLPLPLLYSPALVPGSCSPGPVHRHRGGEVAVPTAGRSRGGETRGQEPNNHPRGGLSSPV
jgi:hypothetical protein